jgi:hypothetical protein
MTTFRRQYRPPPALRVAVRVAYVVGFGAIVLGIIEDAAALFMIMTVGFMVLAVVGGELLVRRPGLYETPEGIFSRGRMWWERPSFWAWSDIEEFRAVRTGVFVILRDGRARPVIGVAQGHRAAWDGGETRDVAGVLNQRLEQWRSEHDAHPTLDIGHRSDHDCVHAPDGRLAEHTRAQHRPAGPGQLTSATRRAVLIGPRMSYVPRSDGRARSIVSATPPRSSMRIEEPSAARRAFPNAVGTTTNPDAPSAKLKKSGSAGPDVPSSWP